MLQKVILQETCQSSCALPELLIVSCEEILACSLCIFSNKFSVWMVENIIWNDPRIDMYLEFSIF